MVSFGLTNSSDCLSFLFAVYAESMDINRSDVIGDRRLRLANSSPDVKALFNSPAGSYLYEDHDPSEQSYLPQGPSGGAPMDYWTQPTQMAPIVSYYRR